MTSKNVSKLQQHVVNSLNRNKYSTKDFTCKDLFLNHTTLRLTKKGRRCMIRVYDNWSFDSDVPNAGDIVQLYTKMTYPYYVDSTQVILFSKEDAFMCKMAGFGTWLDGKT